jgi:hypothetical protein
MTSWTITLGYSSETALTDDQIDKIHEQLADLAVAVALTTDPPAVSIVLTVDAPTVHQAIETAATRTRPVIAGELTSLEAFTTAAFDRALDEPTIPDLVGIAEIAEILGVSRQRAHVLTGSPAFPDPVARLAATPVWRRTAVDSYAAIPRKTGRPSKTGQHTTTGPVAGVYVVKESGHRGRGRSGKVTSPRIVKEGGAPIDPKTPTKKLTTR